MRRKLFHMKRGVVSVGESNPETPERRAAEIFLASLRPRDRLELFAFRSDPSRAKRRRRRPGEYR